MCRLAGVSRATYYRQLAEKEPEREQMETRAAIQEVALAHKRRYGYRRITAELREHGFAVNHKRVVRLMREDNLLAVIRRKYVMTTDSRHSLKVYQNLAARMELTGINQLWIADITYIRLGSEFVYLAVVLDRYSRRVVGWELDRTLAARLAIGALKKALADRQPPPGLVHHSDRGIQYACSDYVELLKSNDITPSMSRKANPYDNAFCESFMKTLKHEEIHCNQYRSLEELTMNIEAFIDGYYNRQRLHSALGYRSPEAFEAAAAKESAERENRSAHTTLSFSRHEEIYRLDGAEESGELANSSPAHRSDEFPTDYSSAGCSPAEPASASSADDDSAPE
jgi:transposase InsO family protein